MKKRIPLIQFLLVVSSIHLSAQTSGYFEIDKLFGVGVVATASNSSANSSNYGGFFEAKGGMGRGLHAIASSTTGLNYGGSFVANGTTGRGVYGRASSLSGLNYGGYFQSDGLTGRAVFGLASATSGANYGGYFKAKGIGGRAVFGESSDVNGTNYGGYFLAKSINGRAVFGLAEYVADGANYGGWFKGKGSAGGTGVYAWGQKYDFYADGPGTNYASASSRRWKKNIVAISNPLAMIKILRGVYYDWDDAHGGLHDIGMIAEEVGEVLPEIVGYEENGIDAQGMDYSKLTPLLVEAIKELNRKVDKLMSQNEALQDEVSLLNAKVMHH